MLESPIESLKVLLVDENSTTHEHLKESLRERVKESEVKWVTSAEKALEKLEEGQIDVIVADYELPETDGLEFLRTLREEGNDIPFIFFTANESKEIVAEALNLGADRYLEKEENNAAQSETLADVIIQEVDKRETSEIKTKERGKMEKLLQKEERYRKIIENANVGVGVYDENKKLEVLNPKLQELTGFTKEETPTLEQWFKRLYPDKGDRQEISQLWMDKIAEEGQISGLETDITRADGEKRTILLSGVQLDSGDVIFFAQDITEKRKVRERLEKSEEKFKRFFEASPDPVYFVNENGVIEEINKIDREGYDKEDIVGLHFEELSFITQESKDLLKEKFDKIKRGEEVEPHVLEMETEAGKTLFYENNAELARENGEILGAIGIARDVTEREKTKNRLKEARSRYEELFKGANEMVITTDRRGHVKRVNRRVEEVSGYSEDELRGESILKIAHPDHQDKYIEFWEKIREGEQPTYELKGETKQGETTYLDARGRPIIEDGEIVEIQYNAQDITEKKEAEERQEFLHSMLRHDLKNKISIVSGYLSLLMDSDLSGEERENVEKAMGAVEKSSELIEKVRTLRKVEQEGEVKEVNLSKTLEKVSREYEEIAEDKGIKVECEPVEVEVQGSSLLEEVFRNVVENALQHSEGTQLRIGCKEEDDKVEVKVEDDGIGISDEDKENVFERGFKRGKSAGSGLGMHIVKRVVENYGGKIEVEDSELGGAKFVVELRKE